MHPRKFMDQLDFDLVTTRAFPATFAGEPLVVEWTGCGGECCTNMAWVELTDAQVQHLRREFPGMSVTEALLEALGPLPLLAEVA